MNNCLSRKFIIERGVRQGSVLTPSLFLLLIDSLLHRLIEANVGVSLEGIYVGTLAHVDDLRSLTCNPHSSEKQALIIHEFLTENFLQLNPDKCELIVHSSGNHFDSTAVKLGSQTLKPTTASKCLGTWWTHNLTSTKSIAENICKARKALFSFGSIGVFHRNLNPLSSNSVIETCVMPVLLFGCESWYLID